MKPPSQTHQWTHEKVWGVWGDYLKEYLYYINSTMSIEVEETDIRILMLRLKDLERKKKAEALEAERKKRAEAREVERLRKVEERKKQQQKDAEERKRQKTKDAINKMTRELGIDIHLN